MLGHQLRKLERTRDGSDRFYEVTRKMQYNNPKALQIKSKNNLILEKGRKRVKLIIKYFRGMFAPAGLPYEKKIVSTYRNENSFYW